jgi:hypothetical protein
MVEPARIAQVVASSVPAPQGRRDGAAVHTFATFTELKFHCSIWKQTNCISYVFCVPEAFYRVNALNELENSYKIFAKARNDNMDLF